MIFRRTIWVLLILLCAGSSLQAQTNNDAVDTTQEKTKFFTKVGYWIMAYGYSSDEFMTERREAFKESAFAEVYVEPLIDHQNWLFQMLNRVTKVRNDDKQDPYIVFETTFKPTDDNFGEFKVAYTITGNWGGRNVSVNLEKIRNDTYNQYLANHTYPTPSDAQADLTSAITAALDQLQDKLKSELAPNVLVRYNDEIFWDGHEIDILDTEGNYVALEAIGKDLQLLNSSDLTWTNADAGPQSTGIVDMTGTSSQTVTLSRKPNDAANTMSVTVKRANMTDDLNDLLKQLIIEALTAKKKEAQEKIPGLKQDSVVNVRDLGQRIAEIEAENFPLEDDGTLPTPMFNNPVINKDSTFVTEGKDARANAFAGLKTRKRIRNEIRKKVNVVALADLIVEKPDQIKILLDALLKNSGRLIAQLLIGKDGDGRREAARNIVVDFLNKNLEQIAGSHFSGNTYPEEIIPVTPTPSPPAFSADRYVYINKLAVFPGRDSLEAALNDFLPNLDTPIYVFINYSQDNSRAGYAGRIKSGRPVGLPEGAKYKVYTFVNMPGSLLDDGYGVKVVSNKSSFVGKIGDDLTAESSFAYDGSEDFTRLLQLIRCATMQGIDEIQMPARYREGGKFLDHMVAINYGLPTPDVKINGYKITYGWWQGKPGATTISGISSPTVTPSTGTITFGDFSIKIPTQSWVLNDGITPFEHFRRYLFPSAADVRNEFIQLWSGSLGTKVTNGEALDVDDLEPLKLTVSCASVFLTQADRFSLLKGILNYRTTEWYEELILDLIKATPPGEDSRKLFLDINSDATTLKRLIVKLDNDGGDRNFDRLSREYFELFIKGYTKGELTTIYNALPDKNKLYFYGFGAHCEWDISAERDNVTIEFEETLVSNVHEKLVGREGLSTVLECDEDEVEYEIGLQEFVAVKFVADNPFTEEGETVILPVAVYYAFIRAYDNDENWERADITWMVIGLVTGIDEFYLLGKALQFSTRGLRAAQLVTVKAMARERKLEIAAEHVQELKAASDASKKGIDDFVDWSERPIVVVDAGEELGSQLAKLMAKLTDRGAETAKLNALAAKTKDISSMLTRLDATKLDPVQLNRFIDDLARTPELITHFPTLNAADASDFAEGWRLLDAASRTGLKRKRAAIEALVKIRKNPRLNEFNITDDVLSRIQSTIGASYDQVLRDLEDAIAVLPKGKVTDFDKVIANGRRGLVADNNKWDVRHSWLTLKKIKENETFLKQAKEIKFEVELEDIDGISNAIPDIVVTPGKGVARKVIGEVKAGNEVITNNFNSQSLRYFQEISDINDLRFFRRSDVSLTKQRVVNSWKNGGITADDKVKDLFTSYFYKTTNKERGAITFSQEQLEKFLTDNDNWFDLMFNSPFGPI